MSTEDSMLQGRNREPGTWHFLQDAPRISEHDRHATNFDVKTLQLAIAESRYWSTAQRYCAQVLPMAFAENDMSNTPVAEAGLSQI